MDRIVWSAFSEKGIGHFKNQDAWLCAVKEDAKGGIFAVADGVGSLDRPEVASKMAVLGVKRWWQKENGREADPLKDLKIYLKEINRQIKHYAEKRQCFMATTLTVLLLDNDKGGILQVGDSKILRDRHGRKEILTIDHLLKEEGLLISCMGNVKAEFNVMMRYIDLKDEDCFYLGTDGVFIKKEWIRHFSFGREKQLIKNLRDCGEKDDLTMISVRIKDGDEQ